MYLGFGNLLAVIYTEPIDLDGGSIVKTDPLVLLLADKIYNVRTIDPMGGSK
ncbi:hypothetical protein Cha6605_2961 [Chamaesiphon minutus PCC 6605]|uniref:Uncharacterized protein n=1 Tax=Chamaesiphon minutus (strain ATCC 27169 / PCC 6605) TaxID=1173020 RepID=K9UH67_CHAP6|nr:hypothetical protein Cha6605_2961 [Chamaesiphon minutus PCC 6605]